MAAEAGGGAPWLAALGLGLLAPAAAETTITLWSHEADEAAKVAWAETAAKNFERRNPG